MPDMQLRPLFDSHSSAPGGANLGFFSDPALDSALDQASLALDAGQRDALYRAIDLRIDEAAPDILLYTPRDLVASRAAVSGLVLMPGGEIRVDGANLAGTAR
jgi:glutathione transport system substrate-binding protein